MDKLVQQLVEKLQKAFAPLLLSEQELTASTYCFPIEFNDMKRQNRLLAGKDVISTLVVDERFYRAQVQHDLRAKLLRLRQKASGILSDSSLLRRLLLDSVSTFCVLFRHALILHGAEGPAAKRDVLAAASQRFGFDPLPFDKLLAIREQQLNAREVAPVALLGSYLEAISVVIAAVDRLEIAPP
jgi:parvulin-like peptidyl-prolyl isomerase